MPLRFRGIPEKKVKKFEHLLPAALDEIRKRQAPGTKLPNLVRAMTKEEIAQGKRVRGPGHEGGAGHGLYDGKTVAVNTSMSPTMIFLNVIHELLHAALPETNEVEIDRLTDVIFNQVSKVTETLERTPLIMGEDLLQELMTPKEQRRLKSAIATGREGRAGRIIKSVRKRENIEHKAARGRFKKAVEGGKAILKRGRELDAPRKKAAFEKRMGKHRAEVKTQRGIKKLRAKQKAEREAARSTARAMRAAPKRANPFGKPIQRERPKALAAGRFYRTPLLHETGPSPITRPDLRGKTLAGGKPPSGATTTAQVVPRSFPSGYAPYPQTTCKKKRREPPIPSSLSPRRGLRVLRRTKLVGA